jgi:hypothetical protein
MSNSFLDAALSYEQMGFSVIPLIPGQKKPMIKWQQYQKERATAEQITKWWADAPKANIGIVTGDVSGVFVVDIDTKEGQENLLQYGFDSIECPTVTTPRDGQHLYFKNPKEKITIGAGIIPGTDFRGNGGFVVAPPSVNGNGKGYSWLVDFSRDTLVPPPAAYINKISTLYRGCSNSVVSEEKDTTKDYKHYKILQEGTRDNDLFHVANCLVKGGAEKFVIEQVLERLILSWGEKPDQKWIDVKIQSAIDRADRRERNLSAEIREWITLQEGYFNTTDILQTLQLTTKEEKKNLTVILTRLNHEGLIEKYGERRGQYKTIQKLEENIIDLAVADNTCLPVKFPLGIHELVKIMPKNIIVVAGESNAGKSAFLLNIAARNMTDHKVFYFSSEMGGAELKERLQNFNEKMPFKMWENCTFIERANDFDIAIRPDDINIIDFLEIHDEFYKIGGFIKKIFDKLEKGIAIIAIQKNKGRDDGLGGARSIEKARLYLSMRPGVIKIVKAKNWVSGTVNPNGLEKQFKLAKGMIFADASNWVKADGD